jgi:hypothetical protein
LKQGENKMTLKQFEKELKKANKIADLDKRFAKMTELMTQRKMSVANTIANMNRGGA